ncbi:hypothetical protein Tco_1370500 [Tanacetum coccineum]
MSKPKFAETHNLVAFLEKPKERDGFEGIIDFLNASTSKYALIIQALVYKKKVIITGISVRSDLQLDDAEGTECQPNDAIFEQLTLMGRKQRKDSGPTEPITDKATIKKHVSTLSCDPPQSGEDRMKLNELMNLCTKLSDRVLALENANTSQPTEIATIKERIKKLEKKKKSRIYKPKRLYKGRKIADIDQDAEVTLVDETQERNNDDLMFDTCVLDGDEVFEEPMVNAATTTSSILVSVDDPVTTAGKIKAAKPKAVTTAATTITTAIANTRPKEKGIVFHDQEEQEHASTQIVSLAQPSSKDKELAFRMHVEEQAELERMPRERVAQEEASRAAIIEELDSIQASRAAIIKADELLVVRLQAEEQDKLSIEEKSRMLVEMIAKRKKFFAAQRAAE